MILEEPSRNSYKPEEKAVCKNKNKDNKNVNITALLLYHCIIQFSPLHSWHIRSRLCLDRQHPKPIETTYTETSLFLNQSSMLWAVLRRLSFWFQPAWEVVWLASEAAIRLLFVSFISFLFVSWRYMRFVITICLYVLYHETVYPVTWCFSEWLDRQLSLVSCLEEACYCKINLKDFTIQRFLYVTLT